MQRVRCKLKIIMIEVGINQLELAEKTGINRSTISLIANEKHYPLLETALIISCALGRPVNEIWYLERCQE